MHLCMLHILMENMESIFDLMCCQMFEYQPNLILCIRNDPYSLQNLRDIRTYYRWILALSRMSLIDHILQNPGGVMGSKKAECCSLCGKYCHCCQGKKIKAFRKIKQSRSECNYMSRRKTARSHSPFSQHTLKTKECVW